MPKATLERHIVRDKCPYDRWALNGLLDLTDCNGTNGYILDYKYIADFIKKFIKDNKLQVLMLGYDAMGIGGIMQDLDEIPCEKVEIGQYPKSLNETNRYFQGLVNGRTINYDKHNELLSWSVVNAISVLNSRKELLIDKQYAKNRIDPIDATINAVKCMLLTHNENDQPQNTIDDWLKLMSEL